MERQLGQLEERQAQLAGMCESTLVEAAAGHLPADGGANELRLAAGVLASVAGSPHAAHRLLAAHSARLKRAQQLLLKPQNAGALLLSFCGLPAALRVLSGCLCPSFMLAWYKGIFST
jgi:hypothetical protein